jgi:pimeloyl-ACP methyl ester carboxylesterase
VLHLRASNTSNLPTIIFLHALGTSGWMWEEQLKGLPEFHCLVPDLPGHGDSRPIPWRSLDQTADLVAEIIRREAPDRCAHIVGLSLGAYVGLTLLSKHQNLVKSAMLSGINVLPVPNRWLLSALGYVIAPLAKTGTGARVNARALKIPADRLQGYRHSLRQVSIRSFIAANRDGVTFSAPTNTAEIRTPTLLIAGEREHPLIHHSMPALEALLPHAQCRLVRDVGHAWNAEQPDLFTGVVRAWCAQRPLPEELLSPEPAQTR